MTATIDLEYKRKYEEIVKNKILELFQHTNARIFLFGSRARGDYKRGSDFENVLRNLKTVE